jgi:hypothetical protein
MEMGTPLRTRSWKVWLVLHLTLCENAFLYIFLCIGCFYILCRLIGQAVASEFVIHSHPLISKRHKVFFISTLHMSTIFFDFVVDEFILYYIKGLF